MKTNCRSLLPLALAAALHLAPLASARAEHETFDLQSYIFCPTGTWCNAPSEQVLRDRYFRQIGEMNLEYQPTGISFRALDPIIIQDDHYSTWSGISGDAGNGMTNAELREEMFDLFARPFPERQTMFLAPNLPKCWNGVPCPGTGNDGLDGDDVVHCFPPGMGLGQVYAHEMGHNFCLQHTHTFNDSTDGTPVDHDGDGNGCNSLSGAVTDTPDDPGIRETAVPTDFSNGVPLDYREWCTVQTIAADPDSPRPSYCTAQCWQGLNGMANATSFAPFPHNAMSYYESLAACRGPYVLNGDRVEAFTEDQIAYIQECRNAVEVRSQLVDVCPLPDGDKDFDGWCDSEDACPNDANTWIVDDDGDGIPNECDLCPGYASTDQTDTDQDGIGDVCDPDDDNDGCEDNTDQNPLDSSVVIGTVIYANCNPHSGPWYAFEGKNSDGDGFLNCEDTDDDNDGIPDDEDSCPLEPGRFCVKAGPTCPWIPIWDVCLLGTCNELLARVRDVINPDPTTDVIFDKIQVVGDKLSLGALAGRTLGESVKGLVGQLPGEGGALPGGKLAIEIVAPLEKTLQKGGSSDPYRVVASLGSYDAREVAIGTIFGERLELELPTATTPLRITGSWAAGASGDQALDDQDRDRIPDFVDVCLGLFNPEQRDLDGDGYGDACDADLDQDGRVTESDYDQVRGCLGVDLTVVLVSAEGDDQPELPPAVPNDPAGAMRQELCQSSDLDGDGVVDGDDLVSVERALGRAPGPSGVMAPVGR